jgi:ABC-type sulfate/molybdate transport systems ATPase subunit
VPFDLFLAVDLGFPQRLIVAGDVAGLDRSTIPALATEPKLLLFDEPFSALDGAFSDALLDRLHGWLRQHCVQAVMATHDVSDALATGAEALLMRQGRLAAQGPAADVLGAERERLRIRLQSH